MLKSQPFPHLLDMKCVRDCFLAEATFKFLVQRWSILGLCNLRFGEDVFWQKMQKEWKNKSRGLEDFSVFQELELYLREQSLAFVFVIISSSQTKTK